MLQSSGTEGDVHVSPAFRFGLGELCGLKGSAGVPDIWGSQNNSILRGRGVVSCTGSEGLVDDGSSEPHAVYLLAVTLPSPALYCFLRASLCHVTKKYSI